MRNPSRLFDHTDWKRKKKVYIFPDVLFSLNILMESKKKVFVVRDEALHFLRGPRLQPA